MEADDLLQTLGGYGRWQMMIYALHGIVWASLAGDFGTIPYKIDTPPYHCKVPENSTFNDTIPATWVNGEMVEFEKCTEYVNRSISNATQPCSNGYHFDPDYGYESTITTDFELVCGKEIYVEIGMMVTTIVNGVMVFVVNFMSDRFGRRTMYLVGITIRPILAITQALMPSFVAQVAVGLLKDIAMLCFMNNAFLLTLEMTPASRRTSVATSMEVFWAVGLMLTTPFLYFFRNWRTLTFVVTTPAFLFYIAFLIPESVTWLFNKGKFKRIEKIVKQALKVNKIKQSEDTLKMLEALKEAKKAPPTPENQSVQVKEPKGRSHSMLDLIRTPRMRIYTIVQVLIWFANSFVYAALAITMTYLPGNRYLIFLFYAIAEVVASLLHVFVLKAFGRRIPMFLFHLVGGVGLMLTIIEVFKDNLGFNWVPLVIAFNIIGKIGIGASFMTLYLYTTEIYPTAIRSQAVAVCGAFGTLANIVSPYSRVLERARPGLLRGVSGVILIIVGTLGLILPETHNRPLPETVEEVENAPRSRKVRRRDNSTDEEDAPRSRKGRKRDYSTDEEERNVPLNAI